MERSKTKLVVVAAGIGAVILLGQVGGVKEFRDMAVLLNGGQAVQPVFALQPENGQEGGDTALRSQIQIQAEKLNEKPVDAVIDRVWKAIPGYNGREIDVEATFTKTLEKRKQAAPGSPEASKIFYVYREIKPSVALEDLGPQPIYKGNPNKKMAALMINVAWGNEYIKPMLDTLDEEKVKATFFFDGSWLKKNPDLAKEIQARGHELENHAYSHPRMSQLSRERATQEIVKTKQLLKDTLGVNNTWFAPPSGDFNQRTVEIAAAQGLKTVLWTVDTVDWKNPDPASVIAKISRKAGPGSLILMHPTASSKASLKGIIEVLKAKGLKLGTVAETLSADRTDDPNG
ncbi:polysaccharide deacetylase family protein [Paenibacillus pinistramenti]|uniref:polysaccharide deacetylase family protein n=1 Tax=Paenibacillus pinistramenti TaxID=1768003 RepID=UPI001EF0D509|nr:polysaccharide deacetylase family protein [Paenibacillus pinistramenti]